MTLGLLGPSPVGMRHRGSPGPRSCALSHVPQHVCPREPLAPGTGTVATALNAPTLNCAGKPGKALAQGQGQDQARWAGPALSVRSSLRGTRRSLQREARSSPLATESGKGTETRPEGAEQPPRASEARRAREAPPADCHVGGTLKAGLPGNEVFSFRLLAPAGPTPTGPCAPPPPAAPSRRARRHHEEILPGDQS